MVRNGGEAPRMRTGRVRSVRGLQVIFAGSDRLIRVVGKALADVGVEDAHLITKTLKNIHLFVM
jgi:hypothetical protein